MCILNDLVGKTSLGRRCPSQSVEEGERMRLTGTREKSIRNSKCKGPEARVTGAKRARERAVGDVSEKEPENAGPHKLF